MKLSPKFSLLLALSLSLKGEIYYSLQLATFLDKQRARLELQRLSKNIDGLFLYRTDSGYWTIRVEKKQNRDEVAKFRKNSDISIIRRGLIVPSDSKKIGNSQKIENIGDTKKIEETRENKKRDENIAVSKKPPSISLEKREIPEIEPRQIQPKQVEKKDREIYKYEPIDTYTFRIRVGNRIYVIQFSDNPDSEMAKTVFDEKPRRSNLNLLIVSNSSVQIPIHLGDLTPYQGKIERAIIPILDKARRDNHIRVKAYRIKKRSSPYPRE